MWVIRLVLFLVLLFLLVYVFASNAGQTVDLQLFGREYLDIGLFWVVAASFGIGFLAAALGMAMREVRVRRERARLRKQVGTLESELTDLRALPLQDLSGENQAKDD